MSLRRHGNRRPRRRCNQPRDLDNGCIGPPRGSARARERRGLRLRAGQESAEALRKIERSPLAETAS
jgi:hypothetical protein